MATDSNTKVKTGKVRMSYVKVFEPDEEGKYGVSLLIPKTDVETYNRLKAAEDIAYNEGKKSIWKGKPGKRIIRDGDEEKPGDEAYAGHWFINAKSNTKPGIVDSSRPPKPITDPVLFYSGCYGRATVNFYPYPTPKSKDPKSLGVACALNNLQFLHHGDPLGSVSRAEDDFNDDFEDDFAEDEDDVQF